MDNECGKDDGSNSKEIKNITRVLMANCTHFVN